LENDIHDLILKSLLGEANDVEAELLQQWLQADEAHLAEYEQLRKSWLTRLPYKRFTNAEEEFDKLWNRVYPKRNNVGAPKGKRQSRLELYVKIAAAFLVLLTVSFLVYKYDDQMVEEPSIATVSKHTTEGQKSRVFLEDGTQVWLNSASEITYPETFMQSDRRSLRLHGEAYFSVAKDQSKPFWVQCDGMTLKVLGTQFNVDASRHDQINVALVEGSVSVQWENTDGGTADAVLTPGEMITINADGSAVVSEDFDVKAACAWKDGMLYFKDATLDEVKRTLELWYGVAILVEGRPSESWQYSGEFDNDVLDNVLLAISFAEEFEYTLNGNTVHIMFN
jgi:ferric-dicitrate binding protein FerR (iron transport regulator)